MENITENQIVDSKEMRDKAIGRVEVLDKVGQLLLIPNTEFATIEQVATFYKVSEDTIHGLYKRNKEELSEDGVKKHKKAEVLRFFDSIQTVESFRTEAVINFDNGSRLKVNNAGLVLFPKRAILRVGMLLRDSEIAKEVRTRLLDVFYDASETITDNGNTIVENLVGEMTEEEKILFKAVKAMKDGNKVEAMNFFIDAIKKLIFTKETTCLFRRTILNKIKVLRLLLSVTITEHV